MRVVTWVQGLLLAALAVLVWLQYQALDEAQRRAQWWIGRSQAWAEVRYGRLWSAPRRNTWVHGLAVKLTPRTTALLKLPQDYALTAAELHVHRYRESVTGTPEWLDASVHGLRLPLPAWPLPALQGADGPLPLPGLHELGVAEVTVHAEFALRYVESLRSLSLVMDLHVADWARIHLATELEADPDFHRRVPEGGLVIRRLVLEFHDLGLAPRWKALAASRSQKSVPELAGALIATLEQWARDQRLTRHATQIETLKRFIHEGRQLYLSMNPPAPLPLRDLALYSPNQWPAVLGLKAGTDPVPQELPP